ncbi:MAG: ABC transporter ATP-binding protein [Dehalococcoidales bacterium]|nr:ABC transporter ATP-binding protein [Dehalococcoidales bacterium]
MRLEIREAAFTYTGETNVFEDLSLTADGEEMLCILGPNGCGKTTLLKCIAGIMKLKGGQVLLDEQDISIMKRNAVAKILGYIPQEHSSPFPYQVLQMVLMGRSPHIGTFSLPKQEDIEIAEESLAKVGILHLKDRRYTQLSGGEKQLVVMARVLAQQPKMLLLDEPTSHLDFKNQTLILQLVEKLAREGLPAIMTTHFPNHALTYSSKVALMRAGSLLTVGSADDVVNRENMREIYGIDVKIHTVTDPDDNNDFKVCVPARII